MPKRKTKKYAIGPRKKANFEEAKKKQKEREKQKPVFGLRTASSKLDAAYEAEKTLPKGHVDRKKHQKLVDEEYAKCSQIQAKWGKRIGSCWLLPYEALYICRDICFRLGHRAVKRIVVSSKEVAASAGGHYCNNEIHVKHDRIYIGTLMHELAHHFDQPDHGDAFCEVLELLYRLAYVHVKKKQPNADW
jgi:hypothetical protein